MTDAEKTLWSRIRGKQLKGYQFYRHQPIGNFIADFYCLKVPIWFWNSMAEEHYTEDGKVKDSQRDEFIRNIGLRILRFSDREVFENIEEVIEKIWEKI